MGSLGRLEGEARIAFSRDIVHVGHQSNSQEVPWMQQAPILRGKVFNPPRPVIFSSEDKVCRTWSRSLQSLCVRWVPLPREECAQDKGLWKLPCSPGRHWGTVGSSGLGAAGQYRLSASFGYLDIGNHKENLRVWILPCAFTWFSQRKLMTVLTVFKQICCFSFDLPLLFLSCSSPFWKLAGRVTVFFMLIVLALPLNSPQMFAEGCLTLNHSSPSFSFYSPLPCSNFPSLSSNNISPKDQVEKHFIAYIPCMYIYNTHMHACIVYMYTDRVCIYICMNMHIESIAE